MSWCQRAYTLALAVCSQRQIGHAGIIYLTHWARNLHVTARFVRLRKAHLRSDWAFFEPHFPDKSLCDRLNPAKSVAQDVRVAAKKHYYCVYLHCGRSPARSKWSSWPKSHSPLRSWKRRNTTTKWKKFKVLRNKARAKCCRSIFGHRSTDTTKEFIHTTREIKSAPSQLTTNSALFSIQWRRSPFSHQLAPRQLCHVVFEHALHWSYSEGKRPQSYGLAASAMGKIVCAYGRKLDCFEKTQIRAHRRIAQLFWIHFAAERTKGGAGVFCYSRERRVYSPSYILFLCGNTLFSA